MKLVLCLFCLVVVLCGCGGPTSYIPLIHGEGYSETRLADDVFRVYFHGNAQTSSERVQDFVMLRAASLAFENGFKYFAVLDEQESTTVKTLTMPGTAHTSGSAYIDPAGFGTFHTKTTYTPPRTYYFYNPSRGLLVRYFKEKPEGTYALDAAFVAHSIELKYVSNR